MIKILKIKDKFHKDNYIDIFVAQIGFVYPVIEKGIYEITMSWGQKFIVSDFDDIIKVANLLNSGNEDEVASNPVLERAEEAVLNRESKKLNK